MTETINSYPIRAAMPVPASGGQQPGRIILVERSQRFDPWVTAWQGKTDGGGYETSWCWGNYHEDFEDALEDFAKRVRRGF